MEQPMAHTFELDGNGPFRKFVTTYDGAFHTLVHAPEGDDPVLPHDILMLNFLKAQGIVPENAPAGVATLRRYKDCCEGGGEEVAGTINWRSNTLQHALGKHKPKDDARANQLIEEIRERIGQMMGVGVK